MCLSRGYSESRKVDISEVGDNFTAVVSSSIFTWRLNSFFFFYHSDDNNDVGDNRNDKAGEWRREKIRKKKHAFSTGKIILMS